MGIRCNLNIICCISLKSEKCILITDEENVIKDGNIKFKIQLIHKSLKKIYSVFFCVSTFLTAASHLSRAWKWF